MALRLPVDIERIKGFMDPVEGEALFAAAAAVGGRGPCLEIGSYCGKSTVYIGCACRSCGSVLYAVDHHRGSEEHQPGEAYHDPDLFDAGEGRVDSFREFRRTLRAASLEDHVVPIVASSAVAARAWRTPLAMVFIDGGHSLAAAITDYRAWIPHLLPGAILAIHDIFPNAKDGGQAPYTIWRMARRSNLFAESRLVKTLGLLRRADR